MSERERKGKNNGTREKSSEREWKRNNDRKRRDGRESCGWQKGGDQRGEIVCSFSIFSIARHP